MHLHRLTLHSSEPERLLSFYRDRLGFGISDSSARHFTLRAGHSRLTFRASERPAYYHFAFNIPGNQIREAQAWLEQRTALLRDGATTIIDFSNWNAEAVYFADPTGNIVEFIARRDLSLNSSAPFDISAIEGVSEIGLPVKDVGKSFRRLQRATGIERYWGDDTHFCAAGDAHGLFIIVDRDSKTWYPTDRPARPFPLEASFSVQGNHYRFDFSDKRLAVDQRQ